MCVVWVNVSTGYENTVIRSWNTVASLQQEWGKNKSGQKVRHVLYKPIV